MEVWCKRVIVMNEHESFTVGPRACVCMCVCGGLDVSETCLEDSIQSLI